MIGRKVSRLGDVIQEPRLLAIRMKGVDVGMFECLNKPWLLNSGIRTVFDVGANTGQFARAIHEVLPEAYIYSFEPLSDCFKRLEVAMRDVHKFQAFNVALADKNGEELFYRSAWSPSSSFLPMGQLHKDNFPFTAPESTVTVAVSRLDNYLNELTMDEEILVKLDVQGCEDKVISGGKCVLHRTKILIVENSMVPLYEGQPLFGDLFTLLTQQGFKYHGALSQADSPIDGSVLYTDSVFTRDT